MSDIQVVNQSLDFFKQQSEQLQDFIKKQELSCNIQGKQYIYVEGWQFLCMINGFNCYVTKTKDLSTQDEIKYKAVAELRDANNNLISRGEAICSKKEYKKKSFDEYAILSMAQTRAIGKACRIKFGFTVKLAGFETTPFEEMDETTIDDKQDKDKNQSKIAETFDKIKQQKEKEITIKETVKTNVVPYEEPNETLAEKTGLINKVISLKTEYALQFEQINAMIQERYNVKNSSFLTVSQLKDLIDFINSEFGGN